MASPKRPSNHSSEPFAISLQKQITTSPSSFQKENNGESTDIGFGAGFWACFGLGTPTRTNQTDFLFRDKPSERGLAFEATRRQAAGTRSTIYICEILRPDMRQATDALAWFLPRIPGITPWRPRHNCLRSQPQRSDHGKQTGDTGGKICGRLLGVEPIFRREAENNKEIKGGVHCVAGLKRNKKNRPLVLGTPQKCNLEAHLEPSDAGTFHRFSRVLPGV